MSDKGKIRAGYTSSVDFDGYEITFYTNDIELYRRVENVASKCIDEVNKHNKKIQFNYGDAA